MRVVRKAVEEGEVIVRWSGSSCARACAYACGGLRFHLEASKLGIVEVMVGKSGCDLVDRGE